MKDITRHFGVAIAQHPFYLNQHSIYFRYIDDSLTIHSMELYTVWGSSMDLDESIKAAWREFDFICEKDIVGVVNWLTMVLEDKNGWRELTNEQKQNIQCAIDYLKSL